MSSTTKIVNRKLSPKKTIQETFGEKLRALKEISSFSPAEKGEFIQKIVAYETEINDAIKDRLTTEEDTSGILEELLILKKQAHELLKEQQPELGEVEEARNQIRSGEGTKYKFKSLISDDFNIMHYKADVICVDDIPNEQGHYCCKIFKKGTSKAISLTISKETYREIKEIVDGQELISNLNLEYQQSNKSIDAQTEFVTKIGLILTMDYKEEWIKKELLSIKTKAEAMLYKVIEDKVSMENVSIAEAIQDDYVPQHGSSPEELRKAQEQRSQAIESLQEYIVAKESLKEKVQKLELLSSERAHLIYMYTQKRADQERLEAMSAEKRNIINGNYSDAEKLQAYKDSISIQQQLDNLTAELSDQKEMIVAKEVEISNFKQESDAVIKDASRKMENFSEYSSTSVRREDLYSLSLNASYDKRWVVSLTRKDPETLEAKYRNAKNEVISVNINLPSKEGVSDVELLAQEKIEIFRQLEELEDASTGKNIITEKEVIDLQSAKIQSSQLQEFNRVFLKESERFTYVSNDMDYRAVKKQLEDEKAIFENAVMLNYHKIVESNVRKIAEISQKLDAIGVVENASEVISALQTEKEQLQAQQEAARSAFNSCALTKTGDIMGKEDLFVSRMEQLAVKIKVIELRDVLQERTQKHTQKMAVVKNAMNAYEAAKETFKKDKSKSSLTSLQAAVIALKKAETDEYQARLRVCDVNYELEKLSAPISGKTQPTPAEITEYSEKQEQRAVLIEVLEGFQRYLDKDRSELINAMEKFENSILESAGLLTNIDSVYGNMLELYQLDAAVQTVFDSMKRNGLGLAKRESLPHFMGYVGSANTLSALTINDLQSAKDSVEKIDLIKAYLQDRFNDIDSEVISNVVDLVTRTGEYVALSNDDNIEKILNQCMGTKLEKLARRALAVAQYERCKNIHAAIVEMEPRNLLNATEDVLESFEKQVLYLQRESDLGGDSEFAVNKEGMSGFRNAAKEWLDGIRAARCANLDKKQKQIMSLLSSAAILEEEKVLTLGRLSNELEREIKELSDSKKDLDGVLDKVEETMQMMLPHIQLIRQFLALSKVMDDKVGMINADNGIMDAEIEKLQRVKVNAQRIELAQNPPIAQTKAILESLRAELTRRLDEPSAKIVMQIAHLASEDSLQIDLAALTTMANQLKQDAQNITDDEFKGSTALAQALADRALTHVKLETKFRELEKRDVAGLYALKEELSKEQDFKYDAHINQLQAQIDFELQEKLKKITDAVTEKMLELVKSKADNTVLCQELERLAMQLEIYVNVNAADKEDIQKTVVKIREHIALERRLAEIKSYSPDELSKLDDTADSLPGNGFVFSAVQEIHSKAMEILKAVLPSKVAKVVIPVVELNADIAQLHGAKVKEGVKEERLRRLKEVQDIIVPYMVNKLDQRDPRSNVGANQVKEIMEKPSKDDTEQKIVACYEIIQPGIVVLKSSPRDCTSEAVKEAFEATTKVVDEQLSKKDNALSKIRGIFAQLRALLFGKDSVTVTGQEKLSAAKETMYGFFKPAIKSRSEEEKKGMGMAMRAAIIAFISNVSAWFTTLFESGGTGVL